jgi:hypothetical protein
MQNRTTTGTTCGVTGTDLKRRSYVNDSRQQPCPSPCPAGGPVVQTDIHDPANQTFDYINYSRLGLSYDKNFFTELAQGKDNDHKLIHIPIQDPEGAIFSQTWRDGSVIFGE